MEDPASFNWNRGIGYSNEVEYYDGRGPYDDIDGYEEYDDDDYVWDDYDGLSDGPVLGAVDYDYL
jgi:hypothetical protein